MNKSLATLLTALTLSLVAAPAFAQTTGAAPDAPSADCHHGRGRFAERMLSPEAMERRITHMTERLSLDARQVTQLREILTASRAQAETLRTSTATTGPARREAFHALMEQTRTRIDAILNDTQRAQFTQMREQRRARFEARHGHGRRGGPAASGADPRGI